MVYNQLINAVYWVTNHLLCYYNFLGHPRRLDGDWRHLIPSDVQQICCMRSPSLGRFKWFPGCISFAKSKELRDVLEESSHFNPIGSMYAFIYHRNQPNLGKYTIPSYGNCRTEAIVQEIVDHPCHFFGRNDWPLKRLPPSAHPNHLSVIIEI